MSTFRFRTLALVAATGLLPLAAGCAVNADESAASSNEALAPVGASAGPGDTTGLNPVGTIAGVNTGPIGQINPPTMPVPLVSSTAVGSGVTNVTLSGQAFDGTTGAARDVSGSYLMIKGRASIPSSGLSAVAQQNLLASLGPQLPGDDELIILPSSAIARAAAYDRSAATGGTTMTAQSWSLCPDDTRQTYTKDYWVDKDYTYNKSTDGKFSGSASLEAMIYARVFASVDYTAKHHWYFGCVPYPVIHSVGVQAAGTVKASAKVDATFSDKWSWQTTVAQPEIGTVTLPIVPIPITFSIPIRVGIDADAKAELHANGSYTVFGGFNLTCTSSGCDGSKQAVLTNNTNTAPTASISAMVHVTPWAEAGLHANVISDSVAYAEAVIRAGTPTDLFGYAGNACGDADGDGTNEWVSGASIDSNLNLDVRAKAGVVGDDFGPWSWNVYSTHIGFWKLYDGGVFQPIFHKGSALMTRFSSSANVAGSMRPCWPYADSMNYKVTWGDGATSPVSTAAHTLFSQSHSFASAGAHGIHLDALTDAKGRNVNTGANTTVSTFGFGIGPVGGLTLAQ